MSLKLFYCYAHEDRRLRDALAKHLGILGRQDLISDWHYRDINAGQEWAKEIDTNLNMADVILLLISSDFVHSDYCYSIEMKRALERHENGTARVIPIILRHCDYEGAPFSKLQALPTDAIPVTDRKWRSLDEAFLSVVQGIRKAVGELHSNEMVSKGNEYLLRKQYKEALDVFEQAIYFNRNNALAYIGKGRVLDEGDISHEEALEAFECAIKIDPTNADAYLGKAGMLYVLDKDNKNEELILDVYRQALRLDPNKEEAYIELGGILKDYSRYEEAVTFFEQAIHIAVIPDPVVHKSMGHAFFHLKRYTEALEAYRMCIKAGLKHSSIYMDLGRTLFNLERYKEALDAFEQAIALDANSIDGYLEKGDTLCQLEKYQEALDAYEKVVNLLSNREPKSLLARVYRSKGMIWQYLAQEAVKKADELELPEDPFDVLDDLPELEEHPF